MTNFNTLEELRTKKELVNYFAQRGQSITEDEIEKLKKSYEQDEENSGALSLKQLDDVAGGIIADPFWRLFYRKNNHSILPHSCPDLSAHAAAESATAHGILINLDYISNIRQHPVYQAYKRECKTFPFVSDFVEQEVLGKLDYYLREYPDLVKLVGQYCDDKDLVAKADVALSSASSQDLSAHAAAESATAQITPSHQVSHVEIQHHPAFKNFESKKGKIYFISDFKDQELTQNLDYYLREYPDLVKLVGKYCDDKDLVAKANAALSSASSQDLSAHAATETALAQQ